MFGAFEKPFHSVEQRTDDAFRKSGANAFDELLKGYFRITAFALGRRPNLPHHGRYDGGQILLPDHRYVGRDRLYDGFRERRSPTAPCDGQRKSGADWFRQIGPQLLLETGIFAQRNADQASLRVGILKPSPRKTLLLEVGG